jgi:hypothetical protein
MPEWLAVMLVGAGGGVSAAILVERIEFGVGASSRKEWFWRFLPTFIQSTLGGTLASIIFWAINTYIPLIAALIAGLGGVGAVRVFLWQQEATRDNAVASKVAFRALSGALDKSGEPTHDQKGGS